MTELLFPYYYIQDYFHGMVEVFRVSLMYECRVSAQGGLCTVASYTQAMLARIKRKKVQINFMTKFLPYVTGIQ